ncbi:MAG: sugar ABC transporter permease [Clostridia bacterium]|nr:sugar ABC transporter permease [Clostridia bacterium]
MGKGYSEMSGDTIEVKIDKNIEKTEKKGTIRKKKSKLRGFFTKENLSLYLLMLPTLVYIFIFHYVPLSGLIMAFQDFSPLKGIWNSPFTDMGGFKHFYNFVTMPDFFNILKNTLVLSVYSIVVNTILPIILALFINEIRNKLFKKTVQTISYAPYFVSVAVVCGMLFSFSNYETGIFNRIITFFGGERVRVMESASLFPHLYVWSGVWQGLGWWAIIYVGTLANVDQSLHEAAIIDGAGRLKRMWHINLPTIIPMAVIMLILSIGNMLSVGFEKVYLMQTDLNLRASRIISTYVYEMSFMTKIPKFSYATAIGLFNSVINIILLWIANTVSRKVGETSLW